MKFIVPLLVMIQQVFPIFIADGNFKAAITIQSVGKDEFYASSYSSLHLTCFANQDNFQLSKEECCMGLFKTVENVCEVGKIAKNVCNLFSLNDIFEERCNLVIAPVSPSYNKPSNYFPIYYMTLSISESDSASIPLGSEVNPMMKKNRFHQYIGRGSNSFAGKEENIVHSPFHAVMEEDVNQSNGEGLIGMITSTLSPEGGMHRRYKHKISLHQSGEKEISGHIFGNIEVLLPITEGVFIDLDSPFDDHIENACNLYYTITKTKSNENSQQRLQNKGARCQVDSVIVPNANIDIEQPSFVSPQHVVTFRISFDFDGDISETLLSLDIEVTTMLHLRYPAPVLKEQGYQKPGFATLSVDPAYLYGGSVNIGSSKDESALKFDIVLDTSFDNNTNLLSLEVAAGFDDHYNFVAAATVIVSFIGAFSMLKDLSKVTVWL